MTLIDARPSEIEERPVPGHWGGDLIKGRRISLRWAPWSSEPPSTSPWSNSRRQGRDRRAGFARILNRLQAQMRRSMTYDQGSEMARHQSLEQVAGLKADFAHPHSPWERGINENTNGLPRQYMPRGEDLGLYSQEQLDEIAEMLNARPRKSLGWKAPAELFLIRKLRLPQVLSAKIDNVALGT